jgi:D-glycero-D-manno-heptose 1,7-bisphosphate phosphatase
MHRMLAEAGGQVDAVFFCPHGPEDGCHCRKPATGLFEQIAERLGISLQAVPVLGDSLRDLQAAQAVGADPMLVLTGKGEKTQQLLKHNNLTSIKVYASLAAAVDDMLA